MSFKGKCAIKHVHGLPKLEPSHKVSSKVIKLQFMVQPQLVKIGGPWTWSMIRGSMDPVHERGSMDPVHGPSPWTRSTDGVHGPGVHVLYFPGYGRQGGSGPPDLQTSTVPYIINHLQFSAWKLLLLGCSLHRTKIKTFIKTFPTI